MTDKKSNVGMIVVLAGVGCLVAVAILGILAAIAIPTFIGYVKEAKAAEARSNLVLLAASLESYRLENGRYPGRSLPRTPAMPGCEKQMWPFDADPGWSEIGFTPFDPIYYSYEYEAGADGASYTIRARGDLDCDGVESLFERTSTSPIVHVENELE